MSFNQENLKKVDRAYDSPSWWYDIRGFFILTFSYQDTVWHQIKFFNRNMREKHLDVAVGSGTLLSLILLYRKMMKTKPVEIYAFDYAERMLDGARQRFKNKDNIHVFRGNAVNLGFSENSFESINIANAFHCFPASDACLHELHRVLKSGGTMALNVLLYPVGKGMLNNIADRINAWGIQKGILYTPYTEEDIRRRILEADFKIQTAYQKGNVLNLVVKK